MTSSRRLALARGTTAATVTLLVSLAGHVSAGGTMPGPLGIAVPFILALMVCVLLAGRRLSIIRLSVSVAVAQFLFHTLFVLGAITPTGTSGAHVHGEPLVLPETTGVGSALVADGGMWALHALAAALTVLALHRGERMLVALIQLAQRLAGWVRRRLAVTLPAPLAPADTWREPVAVPALRLALFLRSRLAGRAPPALHVV